MNRIEIVGMFLGLKKLCEKECYKEVEEIVDAVLKEAQTSDKNEK